MEVLRETAGMEEVFIDSAGGVAYEYTQDELLPSRFYSNEYAAVGYRYETADSNEIKQFIRCVYPEYLNV